MNRPASILRKLSYLWKPYPYAIEKPVVIQFPVIDICNSRCQMCRIWENKKSPEISPAELIRGLRNPLYSEVVSVGLNGGEPTLRKDLGQLASVLFEELPKLKAISLITNGYKNEEVISRLIDVGTVAREHGGSFDVMISLDGYGDLHDRVRGKPGNFKRAEKVLDFIQSSSLVSNVRVGCTIIRENVYGIADLLEYCLSRDVYIKYRLGIPHQRLYTENLLSPYAITEDEKYHVVEFLEGLITHYETNNYQKIFYRSLIDQLIHNAPRKAGCDWKHRGVTITSKGELLYCAVKSNALGKIYEHDSQKIYFGNQRHLHNIVTTQCDRCTHDYLGIPPKNKYFRQLARNTAEKLQLTSAARRLYRYSRLPALRQYIRFHDRLAGLKYLSSELQAVARPHRIIRRVMICGWYGTETLGDKAILGAVIHAIYNALGKVELTLSSLNLYVSEATKRQMTELGDCSIIDSSNGVQMVPAMDLVVMAGGPLMAINELADIEAIFTTAKAHGIPALIAGCGVGPLGSRWHNNSLRRILSLATLRIYRDSQSRTIAGQLGIDTSFDRVTEDPAFTWLFNQRDKLTATRPVDRQVLLLGLRDFPYTAYARHLSARECQTLKKQFEHTIIDALETLAEMFPQISIRPVPMCTNHFGHDDRWFYRRLFRGSTKLQRNLDLSLLNAELPPIAICEIFRSSHVALAMRFHATVFALGLNVPTIAIDYTFGAGKVHSLAEFFGIPHKSLDALDANFIISNVCRLLENPADQTRTFKPKFTETMLEVLPTLSQPEHKDICP